MFLPLNVGWHPQLFHIFFQAKMLYKLNVELDEPPKQKHEVVSVKKDGKVECFIEFKTKRLLNNFLIKHGITQQQLDVYNNSEDNEKLIFVKRLKV